MALGDDPVIDAEMLLTAFEDTLLGAAMLLDYKLEVDFRILFRPDDEFNRSQAN